MAALRQIDNAPTYTRAHTTLEPFSRCISPPCAQPLISRPYKRYAYVVPAPSVALITDIIDSRLLDDRAAAQSAVLTVFASVADHVHFRQPLWATVGDEFQAVFDDVPSALRATTLAQLILAPEVRCRFGIGEGIVHHIDSHNKGTIQDGSAWWNARKAIEEAHRRQDVGNPYVRSWFAAERNSPETVGLVNAYALVRDQVIHKMGDRERRLTAGILLGKRQIDLAKAEGISQSAVSQSLQRSGGAALIAAYQALPEERTK